MANRLTKIRVNEISLVDEPASPGAVVLFGKRKDALDDGGSVLLYKQLCGDALFEKRDVSDEPRDERGRWSAGGIGAAVASRLRQLKNHALNIGRKAVNAVRTGRVKAVDPVQNGGVQFTIEHDIPNHGTLRSTVQIHPEHLGDNKILQSSLQVANRALVAYGRQVQQPIEAIAPNVFSFPGGVRVRGQLSGVATTSTAPGTPWRPQGAGGLQAQNELRPSQAQIEANANTAPDNGLPLVRQKGGKDNEGRLIPLNFNGVTADHAGGWPFYTKDGDFVPSGSPQIQRAIERFNLGIESPVGYGSNARSTAEQSGGKAYLYGEDLNLVPAASHDTQKAIEFRYDQERARVSAIARAENTHADAAGVAKLFKPTRTTLFKRAGREHVQLFSKRHKDRSLFADQPSLFEKYSAAQARDNLGRWSAGARANIQEFGSKVRGLVSQLKQPSTVAGIAAKGAAGVLGIPDAETHHLGAAIEHAVGVAHAKIASDPRYMQFAAKLGSTARNLFRKNRDKMSELEHDELKGHMARIMSQMPLDRKIAGDDLALAAVVHGVHHRLYSQLGN